MEKNKSFIRSIFTHADGIDILLMIVGFMGAVGDGVSTPVLLFDAVTLLYASCGFWVACFFEGYCWARTGERQATRMRSKYLKAVLRQEVGYFDLQSTTTTEVITSVSNDTLVIQDTISEKVPNFLMNVASFVGGNIIAFVVLWKLALVAFPFMLLLVIPGFMYGRTLMGLARKNRNEYNQAGNIAEQAIASVRTVYSFVGEKKTMKEFSEALQGTVKLGLEQGLTKGLGIGGDGIVFAIWAFMFWYGSRMVMYHGTRGGDVFAVGSLIAVSGR
ncbi:hypothetical protein F0562_033401 [Nyssa sinensis]|uniref:ABC transmembrane type-1 domain-containing protein n=1 Tax=Nyssa sinensis TaxID=561372 RepID=A0A5J5AT90_9ASTE|nr:hypothetical protein F0562_033401 [Nyssa sinensis]